MNRMVLLACCSTAACALTTGTVAPPTESVAVGLSGGRRRAIQVAIPFADERPDQSRCGIKKNGYNVETANIVCSAPPQQWLAELLAAELTAAGFEVASSPAPGALRLQGSLLQFFVEPDMGAVTFSPETDIHVRLIATADSGLLAERSFYVKGVEISMVATADNFQRAVNDGVRSLLREMVAAVIALSDRYPAGGPR